MLRQLPSRTKKSKRMKVRHFLWFCLFLAICFWLIYQVKHFHDKKKEFDENDAKISLNTGNDNEISRLGRKDIYPRGEETVTKNEKHDEEAEEETAGEEEENKHQEEAQEQEDNKTEEREDEGRGGEDDGIDEHDEEKSDSEMDHEENFLDEEERERKESEEKDEDKDVQMENESSLEDHDRDGTSRSAHEAREEHYKADDASSAVVQDTQINRTENENGSSENSNEHTERNTLEQENKINRNEKVSVGQNMTGLKVDDSEMAGNGGYLNATADKGKGSELVSSKSKDGLFFNLTASEINDHPQLSNNSTEPSTETLGLSLHNATEVVSDFTRVQNAMVGSTTSGEGSIKPTNDQSDSNEKNSIKPEDVEATPGDSSRSLINPEFVVSEVVARSNTSAKTEHGLGSSLMEEISDATDIEKLTPVMKLIEQMKSRVPRKMLIQKFNLTPINSSDSSIPLE